MSDIIVFLNINSGAITGIANVIFVIITAGYSILVYLTLEEMQKSRKIQSIENNLGRFYIPIQDVVKNSIVQFDIIRKEIDKFGPKRLLEDDLIVGNAEYTDIFLAWKKIIQKGEPLV